ncbi:hypothetical protein NBRC116594_17270 [Shimia sp. NS0008-38b]|uniref:hypothetical protein n=1 Tax=Shimia sp. NS0008-38b TaxID=3127653 RepID=UPI00310C0375
MPVFALGCAAPSPYFQDVPATRVQVEGTVFAVRHKGRLAEATRLNTQFAPNLMSIAPHAETALRAVTGCDVIELRGDAAQVLGILHCDQAQQPHALALRTPSCEVVDVFVPAGAVTGYLEAECD